MNKSRLLFAALLVLLIVSNVYTKDVIPYFLDSELYLFQSRLPRRPTRKSRLKLLKKFPKLLLEPPKEPVKTVLAVEKFNKKLLSEPLPMLLLSL